MLEGGGHTPFAPDPPPPPPTKNKQFAAYEGLTVLEGTAANVKEAWRRCGGPDGQGAGHARSACASGG